MRVDVISTVNEARSEELSHKTVIVIDVLRATSTIVTALEHGSIGVIPIETVNQAKSSQTSEDLLGGERYNKKIPGFHFGNSPLEYMSEAIQGKRILLTTTNGTRALNKAQKADYVIAGSMLNARACMKVAKRLGKHIAILCSGTQDEFSLEDGLCAGLLIEELLTLNEFTYEINDLGRVLYYAYLHKQHDLIEAFMQSDNGSRLCKLGLKQDVLHCAAMNTSDIVPLLKNGILVPAKF